MRKCVANLYSDQISFLAKLREKFPLSAGIEQNFENFIKENKDIIEKHLFIKFGSKSGQTGNSVNVPILRETWSQSTNGGLVELFRRV